jgi:hypothetical protein
MHSVALERHNQSKRRQLAKKPAEFAQHLSCCTTVKVNAHHAALPCDTAVLRHIKQIKPAATSLQKHCTESTHA